MSVPTVDLVASYARLENIRRFIAIVAFSGAAIFHASSVDASAFDDDEVELSKIDAICRAASAGDTDAIKRLLNEDSRLRNATNTAGFSALHYASMHGRIDAARLLMVRMVDGDSQQANTKGAPLQYAANRGHMEVVKLLVESGMEVDSRDANQRTPLIWAIMGKQKEVVVYLVESGAELSKSNLGGWTPLHYAYQSGDEDIIDLLIEAGADQEVKNVRGLIPNQIPVKTDSRSR